jgi:hypothetical protein
VAGGSRGDLEAEQERYLAAYEDVKARLLQIPGVLDVGVGLKETGDGLTQQIAYRVFVEEKRPEAELTPDAVVPREVDGFVTDVIKVRRPKRIIGFNDENDRTNYKTKVGGIRIGNDRLSAEGTLGAFFNRTSDNKTVLLSNHHVLFDPDDTDPAKWPAMKGKSRVGQPTYDESCCCECNAIATVVDGDPTLDCAIALVDDGVPLIPKIKQIRRPDGSLEADGFITGDAPPVSGHEVWKIGARTGLTRGTISQIAPDVEIHPIAPFTRIADHGDSGSVVVDKNSGRIVALLKSIDVATGNLGFATNIVPVLAFHGITSISTDPTQTYNVAEVAETRGLPHAEPVFNALTERLAQTERGRWLLERADEHRDECRRLVDGCRPVTVCWHRHEGPQFLAALARSARVPEYAIPQEIDGIGRRQALEALRDILTRHGSPELARDLARPEMDVFVELAGSCDTVQQVVDAWERRLTQLTPAS